MKLRTIAAAAVAVLAVGCTTSPPPASNPARDIAVQVFSGTQYTEPLGSNVTWVVAVPTLNGQEVAGLTWDNDTCIGASFCRWTVTIHPDYLRADVVAHEGGHIVCWVRYLDNSEACADRIMAEVAP